MLAMAPPFRSETGDFAQNLSAFGHFGETLELDDVLSSMELFGGVVGGCCAQEWFSFYFV